MLYLLQVPLLPFYRRLLEKITMNSLQSEFQTTFQRCPFVAISFRIYRYCVELCLPSHTEIVETKRHVADSVKVLLLHLLKTMSVDVNFLEVYKKIED